MYYSPRYIDEAHRLTIFHEEHILRSSRCTCFYCGYQFDPQREQDLVWWDEESPKGRTLTCPKCGIDCILGDASGYPITDKRFIRLATEMWFSGYSRISDGLEPDKIKQTCIEVS